LHHCAMYGHLNIITLLVEKGADINVTNNQLCTPLHIAARWGHQGIIFVLHKIGVDANKQDMKGDTCLHEAAYWGRYPICETLISLKVNNLKNYEGKYAYEVASTAEIQKLLQNYSDQLPS